MQLHRLTLRAIGPYRGEHTVDFEELGASGVFLLEGPTGSGKSTVIDAIVFGLYGGLAGSTSSDDRLHSHHAAPDVEPFVELVFSTGAGIYRIRRSPKWQRPKSRGTGTTPQNAKATLERLTSPDARAGEAMSSSAQEIGAEVPALVGLTREQFTQTVVLPQGEFARFLAASGEDRRRVLQSLFGTKIYDDTTAVLVDLRRAAHAEVGAAQRAVDEALASLRGAADDETLTLDDAAEVVARFTGAAAEAVADRDEAGRARDAAQRRLQAETALGEALVRRAALLARREGLVAETGAVGEWRTRVDLGRRAATVLPARDAHRRAVDAVALATGAVGEAEASDPEHAGLDVDALDTARDGLLGEMAALRSMVELEAGLDARARAVERSDAQLQSAAEALDHDERALEGRGAARDDLVQKRDAVALRAAGLDAAERRVAELAADSDALRSRDEIQAALERAGASVAAATSAARDALAHENALRRRRIEGMAGELAVGLADGEPCVVCGATSHPSPAVLVDGHPSDDEIETAAALRSAAETRLQREREASAALVARLDEAARRVGDLTPAVLAERVALAAASSADARRARDDETAAREAVLAHDSQTAALAESIQAARVTRATATERLETERRSLADDRARLVAALAGRADSCADLAERLRADEVLVSTLVSARRRHARAVGDEASRADELSSALAAAGFEAVADVDEAAVSRGELDELSERIERHDRDRAVVDEQLASPDLRALTGAETVDVEAVSAAARTADETHAALADVASRASDRAARASRALVGVHSAVAAAEAASSEAKAVVRMADVASANGPENLHGVTLGTYVLLRRFDDVLAAANSRLQVMSSGRYRLESSDAREKGSSSRKTGLALAIRDNATGTTRDPKSFSGGETFYASLSLALGLADVVQAEAGGIDLGTLFVDEGFGSLDPETLDSVMSELGRLSAGGRVVGIVSHVDELKQRIADRIEVRRLPDGSSTLRTTVG